MNSKQVFPNVGSPVLTLGGGTDHQRIYFISTSTEVHQLTFNEVNQHEFFTNQVLTGIESKYKSLKPKYKSPLVAYEVNNGDTVLLYIATDGQIYSLYYSQSVWHFNTVTGPGGIIGAPTPASYSPLVGFIVGVHPEIYYIGEDGELYQLFVEMIKWGVQKLTGSDSATGGPTPASTSTLSGFAFKNETPVLYYINKENQICELIRQDKWNISQITVNDTGSGKSPPVEDSPIVCFEYEHQRMIFYIADFDKQIHQAVRSGQSWLGYTLTGGLSGPDAPKPRLSYPQFSGFLVDSQPILNYISIAGQIFELQYKVSPLKSEWKARQLTRSNDTGSPPPPSKDNFPISGFNVSDNGFKLLYISNADGRKTIIELSSIFDTDTFTSLKICNDWLTENHNLFASSQMKNITFPGTHNSYTYDLEYQISPSAPSFVEKIFGIPAMRPYLQKMAKTVSLSGFDQLLFGIRYFDVRIVINDEQKIVFSHSLVSKTTLDEVWNDLHSFLEYFSQEVVIWKIKYEDTQQRNDVMRNYFKAMVEKSTIARYIQVGEDGPRESKLFCNETLQFVVNAGKRLIIVDHELVDGIYNSAYNEPIQVKMNIIVATEKPGRVLFEPQCFLPPSLVGYVLGGAKFFVNEVVDDKEAYDAFMSVMTARLPTTENIVPLMATIGYKLIKDYLKYFVPTSLKEIADTSGKSIFMDYYAYIVRPNQNTVGTRPMLIIQDFPDDDYVDFCISMTKQGLSWHPPSIPSSLLDKPHNMLELDQC